MTIDMDGKISQFLKMQHDLAVEKGWIDGRTPENAPYSILWSIDELGEAIAIIKKKGADGIMNNESVREHFVEEISDTFMYLFDMMECYGITSEEFTSAYVKKYERNMGRSWHENKAMYEKCRYGLVIFDLTEKLLLNERLAEVLSRTELKLAVMSQKQLETSLPSETFDMTVTGTASLPMLIDIFEHFNFNPELVVVCTDSPDTAKNAKELGMTCAVISGEAIEGADIQLTVTDELQDFLGF